MDGQDTFRLIFTAGSGTTFGNSRSIKIIPVGNRRPHAGNTMKIPPYWAKVRYEGKDRKGYLQEYIGCGWSFSSLQEAQDKAL